MVTGESYVSRTRQTVLTRRKSALLFTVVRISRQVITRPIISMPAIPPPLFTAASAPVPAVSVRVRRPRTLRGKREQEQQLASLHSTIADGPLLHSLPGSRKPTNNDVGNGCYPTSNSTHAHVRVRSWEPKPKPLGVRVCMPNALPCISSRGVWR